MGSDFRRLRHTRRARRVHTKPLRLRVHTTWEAAHRNGASAADRRQVRYNAAKAIRAETGRGGGVTKVKGDAEDAAATTTRRRTNDW